MTRSLRAIITILVSVLAVLPWAVTAGNVPTGTSAGGMVVDAAADATRGERLFQDCRTCHSVTGPAGEILVRGGRTGPNLHAVFGRHAGSVPGFYYSESMVAAGNAGLRWNETDFVAYVKDPTAFLQAYLDDPEARGKMAFKLRDADKARDIWAYLERIAHPEAN